MSAIPASTTVGQLVAERPARARLFEKLRIDYCCGGKQSLQEACATRGIDIDVVQQALEAFDEARTASPAGQDADWQNASMTDLAYHIEQTHHQYLRAELPRLQMLIRKVAHAHGSRYPWVVQIESIFAGLVEELTSHMLKEERILFPVVRQMEQGGRPAGGDVQSGIAGPIDVMEHEHDAAGSALERMHELSDGYTPPQGACNTFLAMLDGLRELEADMHVHVHKENNVLFPRALELERKLKADVA